MSRSYIPPMPEYRDELLEQRARLVVQVALIDAVLDPKSPWSSLEQVQEYLATAPKKDDA